MDCRTLTKGSRMTVRLNVKRTPKHGQLPVALAALGLFDAHADWADQRIANLEKRVEKAKNRLGHLNAMIDKAGIAQERDLTIEERLGDLVERFNNSCRLLDTHELLGERGGIEWNNIKASDLVEKEPGSIRDIGGGVVRISVDGREIEALDE